MRDLRVLEGARSLTRDPGVRVLAETRIPVVARSSLRGRSTEKYETLWAGRAGQERWTLRVELPEVRTIDRISLTLGLDAVTVPTGTGPVAASREPTSRCATASLRAPTKIPRTSRPLKRPSPERKRRTAPHAAATRSFARCAPVRELELTITKATGPSGEDDDSLAAPVSASSAFTRRPTNTRWSPSLCS